MMKIQKRNWNIKKIINIFTTFHESRDSVEFPIFNGGLSAEGKVKYLNNESLLSIIESELLFLNQRL